MLPEKEHFFVSHKRKVRSFYKKCLIFLQCTDDLDPYITSRYEQRLTSGVSQEPYVILVGSAVLFTESYAVIGQVRYKTTSVVKAFEVCLKCFLASKFMYPKATCSSWLLLQKIWLKLDLKTDRSSVGLTKTLSFMRQESNAPHT